MNDEQLVVLEMVKAWLENEDANVLAAERVIVRWTSLDGDATNLGWKKDSLNDTVNILRGVVVPLPLMKYMSTDVLLAAAQESERMYERGVNVFGIVLPQFFNYAAKRKLNAHEAIIKEIILMCKGTGENVLSASVNNVIDKAFRLAYLEIPTRVYRNRIINSLKELLGFKYRLGSNRLSIRTKPAVNGVQAPLEKYTCIQIIGLLSVPISLDEVAEDEWSRKAVSKAILI